MASVAQRRGSRYLISWPLPMESQTCGPYQTQLPFPARRWLQLPQSILWPQGKPAFRLGSASGIVGEMSSVQTWPDEKSFVASLPQLVGAEET